MYIYIYVIYIYMYVCNVCIYIYDIHIHIHTVYEISISNEGYDDTGLSKQGIIYIQALALYTREATGCVQKLGPSHQTGRSPFDKFEKDHV